MDWVISLIIFAVFLMYQVVRIRYECRRDKLTLAQWWRKPLPKEDEIFKA
ncbi:hypothetical protein [Thalassotalea maritima]